MQRWIKREGAIVEHGGVAVVEFRSTCSLADSSLADNSPIVYRSADDRGAERAGAEVPASGCGMCGAGSARRLPVILLDLDASARPGDRVSVRVGAAALNRIAAVCFAVPLAALLAGAAVGRLLPAGPVIDADVSSGLVGLGCLALAFVMVGRNGGALLRMLELDARLERMDR
jgi:hypothetical protein